jgi:hypothetical protein
MERLILTNLNYMSHVLHQTLHQPCTFCARLALGCLSACFISPYFTSINHFHIITYDIEPHIHSPQVSGSIPDAASFLNLYFTRPYSFPGSSFDSGFFSFFRKWVSFGSVWSLFRFALLGVWLIDFNTLAFTFFASARSDSPTANYRLALYCISTFSPQYVDSEDRLKLLFVCLS